MNVPGITSPDMSATINGAVKAGWIYIGTASNHTRGQIQWPATGEVVNFSTTPKSGGWKTVAQQIYAASGIDLRRKGSNNRSRKAVRPSGFNIEHCHASAASDEVARLTRLHDEQAAEWSRLTDPPDPLNAQAARDLLPQIQRCEERLAAVYQPFTPIVRLDPRSTAS